MSGWLNENLLFLMFLSSFFPEEKKRNKVEAKSVKRKPRKFILSPFPTFLVNFTFRFGGFPLYPLV